MTIDVWKWLGQIDIDIDWHEIDWHYTTFMNIPKQIYVHDVNDKLLNKLLCHVIMKFPNDVLIDTPLWSFINLKFWKLQID